MSDPFADPAVPATLSKREIYTSLAVYCDCRRAAGYLQDDDRDIRLTSHRYTGTFDDALLKTLSPTTKAEIEPDLRREGAADDAVGVVDR
jgi:hypothetical protein